MPKFLFSLFPLLVFSSHTFSQNEAEQTLFTNNYANLNPAMSGLIYKREANVLWRNQWTAVNGAPTTLWANYNQQLRQVHGSVGLNYYYDVIGHNKMHTAVVNYAYHVQFKKTTLSFGVSAGIKSLNKSGYIPPTTIYDPALPTSSHYTTTFDAQAGVAIHTKKLNAGFSITQLNRPTFRFKSSNFVYDIAPIYHLHADYTFTLTPQWKITPAVHVFSDRVKTGSTTSVKATVREKLWFGLSSWNLINFGGSFRTIGFMAGYDFKEKFRIGYNFELNEFQVSNSKNDRPHNYTHEIVLSYLIK